jgi:hypothetical protein
LNTVELHVDLTIIVVKGKSNMNHVTILLFAFLANIGFEFLLPTRFGFSARLSAMCNDMAKTKQLTRSG